MSSHIHLVVLDPSAELPKFMHALDLAIAKAMNAELGRRENLWRPGSSTSRTSTSFLLRSVER